jgi:tRNA(Ile)-lysidine synthase TilS/MesJ
MRKLMSLARRCIDDYEMISEGENIAVGVSGGKDSLALLAALAGLMRFYPKRFSLKAILLDMGFEGAEHTGVQAFCDAYEVPLTIVNTDIKTVVFDIREEKNPCALCANLRRGALHEAALSLGCKKVALGHHMDDAVETFLMSLNFEGRLHSFAPVTYLDRRDITLIRPLLYIKEGFITELAKKYDFPVRKNPCPADGFTRRQDAKELIREMNARYPGYQDRVFQAMRRLPLPGWEML